MKAIVLKENGGIENLHLTEIEKPEIRPEEVLIQVKAIAVNPVDAFVRQHNFALRAFLQPKENEPVIPGWDISGIVVQIGEKVDGFQIGDEVFGMVNFAGHGKAYAEYAAAPASHLALKPQNITHEEAAASCLAALTAWQSLKTHAKVKKGDKVLIHAAAGGVGHYAVQMAKHLGAYVLGTASSSNLDFVISLGADEFIDYTVEKFEDKVKDADIVLEALYGDHILRSLEAVKNGGTIISLLNMLNEESVLEKIRKKDVFAYKMIVNSNGNDMKEIAGLLADGIIKPYISHFYTFEDIPKAHTQIETGKTKGKIVITI